MHRTLRLVSALSALALSASPALAQVAWTNWGSPGVNTIAGTITSGAQTVGVTYTGPFAFAQNSCGTNYWNPSAPYISPSVPNAPTNCQIVALATGGLKTITFSQAVVNPILALVSWNVQPGVVFSGPIEILSQGAGFWGNGTFSVLNGNTLVGAGEAHGVIRLLGTYTSISFTDGSENWHGFQVGIQGVDGNVVPEPATLALTAGGLLALAAIRRRRAA